MLWVYLFLNAQLLNQCCQLGLNEDDISYLNTCVSSIDAISEEENAALYYISGYVQYKISLSIPIPSTFVTNPTEFTKLVSRGQICHPIEHLFKYVRYAYSLFILLPHAEMQFQSARYISKLFIYLYTSTFRFRSINYQHSCFHHFKLFFQGYNKIG